MISVTPDQHLQLLTDILQEYCTSLDIEATLQRATEQVKQYLDADGVSVFMLENDASELVCRCNTSDQSITGLRMPADKGIVGRALRESRTQMVLDTSLDPDFYQGIDEHTGTTTRSVLCAPLQVRQQNIGALEAVNKASGDGLFNENDANLLTILATAASMAIHNAGMAQELLFQDRTRRDLEVAREVQSALLPDHNDAHPVFGINLSARIVSGDFYDYFQYDDGRIYFCLGDVSGKGMNAALLMAKTSALFRCLGKKGTPLGELMGTINNELHANAARGMFVTMVAGIYEPEQDRVTLVNAGHQPPLLMSVDRQISSHDTASPPLGIVRDMVFEESVLELGRGALYVFTDGLTECWVERGKALGEEGVCRMLQECADLPPQDRLQEITRRTTRWKLDHSGYLFDDVTMLMVQPA